MWKCHTCKNNQAEAEDDGASVCSVLRSGELVPDARLL